MLNCVARFCHLAHLKAQYRFHGSTLLHHCKSLNYISSAADYVIKSSCAKCMESGKACAVTVCVYGFLGPPFLFPLADCCPRILFPCFYNLVCGI